MYDSDAEREKFKRPEERGVWNSQPPEEEGRRIAHAPSTIYTWPGYLAANFQTDAIGQ